MIVVTRTYKLKRRAEQQDETRRQIVEAAVELHQTVGPAATTIAQIAERAGVGRVTVYRHFPDEAALLEACSSHYEAQHPLPDPEAWRSIADPRERLRTALLDAYAYHRETEAMLTRVFRDVPDHAVVEPYYAHWRHATEVLLGPFRARGRRRAALRAGIALALAFETWRVLAREQGLSDGQAVELMLRVAG
jgi:AcrR family transcriptional regulator